MKSTRKVMIIGKGGQFVLSVNPKEITVTQSKNDKTIDLLNVGTINIPGKRGLITTSIQTFLPANNSPFCKKGDKSPKKYIKMIKKWKNSNKTVRLIISGTDVNTLFTIASAEDKYIEGQKDVYVTWNFTEDRTSSVTGVSVRKAKNKLGLFVRSNSIEKPKYVRIKNKTKDSLWNLAVKYYQDGTKWTKIADINNITNPDKIKIGQKVVIPK